MSSSLNSNSYTYSLLNNWTDSFRNATSTAFNAQLERPVDTDPNTVWTSVVFNSMIFAGLMASYECLRRILPAVYSSQSRLDRIHHFSHSHCDHSDSIHSDSTHSSHPSCNSNDNNGYVDLDPPPQSQYPQHQGSRSLLINPPLPEAKPLDWVYIVHSIPWEQVRTLAGLDGYLFLRFIRMHARITAVSTIWFFLILVPIYYFSSGDQNIATGWYHFSIQNVPIQDEVKLWVPCAFLYLFSLYVIFVIRQEYRHFLELRQDFLARGSSYVHPQHHYSLMIENIPIELRSDAALKQYFERLFPGKVHSASVVLNLPDLEETAQRCLRTCRRLEKSIAYWHATGQRLSHFVGRGRVNCLGVDLLPCGWRCCWNWKLLGGRAQSGVKPLMMMEDEGGRYIMERPERGTRVDSISYYTQELAADRRALFKLQQHKLQMAESGNPVRSSTSSSSITGNANNNDDHQNWNWNGLIDQVFCNIQTLAQGILIDSTIDNDLSTPHSQAFASKDGYYSNIHHHQNNKSNINYPARIEISSSPSRDRKLRSSSYGSFGPTRASAHRENPCADVIDGELDVDVDLSQEQESGVRSDHYCQKNDCCRRLGLDCFVSALKAIHSQWNVAMEGVVSATMSSTGFVTFLDLSSTTFAASAPLTVKPYVLQAGVAPEPRDLRWQNAHVSRKTQRRRESIVNVVLGLGVILWSFPVAAIQAFAKIEKLKQIPGFEWIDAFHGGKFANFVNGYLPVVAFLCLILILPVVFEYTALNVEHRKTFSDVQASMLTRYFCYQLANVYITVTAGSLLKSLGDIINHPSSILQELGKSLPEMAGYFVALLVTKILAGLPMIFLRIGALSRMLFLKTLSNERKLTQREIDAVYRLENVQYGWEFPTQLLVVVIVFTYAVICPVILPVGCCYFLGALTVYKKQVIYVYSPVYESGGAMFPLAVQLTLFGLVCGQMTFIGYLMIKGCYYQPFVLFPLPLLTLYCMSHFSKTYAEPSKRLSLERARQYDRWTALQEIEKKKKTNNKESNETKQSHQHSEKPATASLNENSTNTNTEGMGENTAGIEARRRKFDKSAYRQPVLTELAAEPWTYRRGIEDKETVAIWNHLRQVNLHSSMMIQPQQSQQQQEQQLQQQPSEAMLTPSVKSAISRGRHAIV